MSALAVCAFIGCSDDGRPPTYKVSGLVTLDGKPVEGALVSFMRTDNGPHNAVATTDASGKYELTTFESRDGAVEGSYNVTVTKYGKEKEVSPYEVGSENITIEEGDAEGYEDAYSKAMAGGTKGWKPPKTWNDVPDKYATSNTSGLSFDVAASKEPQTYDLPLTKK